MVHWNMVKQMPASDIQILSPKSDMIFRRIFGVQENADILGGFLKSVLDLPEDEYERLTIVDPHLLRDSPDDKLGILDVKLHSRSGKIIDIEIQVLRTQEIRDRVVWYVAKMVTEQTRKSVPTSLKKVICILITDYTLIKENEVYRNRYHLYDTNTGSKFTDVIEVNTLELPKLPGIKDDTKLWEWLKFLKSKTMEEFDMLSQNNPEIKRAVGVLMELSADEVTRLKYESREKARWDEMSRMREAREEGLAEGEAKGEAKGRIEVAKNLLLNGISGDIIAKATGLSPEEIERLSNEE
jgi:predicted transposase/invertase (TIGR01784 family)